MSQDIYSQLSNSLIVGDPESAGSLTKQAKAAGIEPLEIINEGLIPGMNAIGEQFSRGEYFLPDLIVAGEGM